MAPRRARKAAREAQSPLFWLTSAYVVIIFLFGGSARPDPVSLALLRPLGVIACGVGLYFMNAERAREYRPLLGLCAACLCLTLLHLLPLPPALWSLLPGRDIVVEIDRATRAELPWRPLSMVPSATWNALFAQFVVIGGLLLAMQLSRREQARLLYVILACLALSAALGVVQVIGSDGGPAYLYRVTNSDSAVGLFANRNHFAAACACGIPMLAAAIDLRRPAAINYLLAIAAILFFAMVLIAGSRAGLVLAVIALALSAFVIDGPTRKRLGAGNFLSWKTYLALGSTVAILIGLFAYFSRSHAVQNLAAGCQSEDVRFQVWGPILKIAADFFPFGSGIGSFVPVYKIYEPAAALGPTYLNHAHNDPLEILMTSGLPGVGLALYALWVFVRWSFAAYTDTSEPGRTAVVARAATLVIALLTLSSVADYPLRTPSLGAFCLIALMWLRPAERALDAGHAHRN